eukprot:CAMPEP_0169083356 /NCGR_PEP_ID=MMETSP1015-20121227/12038_1 /TAXON_ID=342587 /ORGANISM="Karlodinium micrum, Strain CCMP2283" /LENGTH=143 /DNA_ID=CAMNT_0009143281 /DNA_START=80 /DNA_END=511 /DNA_ORIENTATION=-
MSRNSAYAVEAFNILVLILFLAWMPFCFQIMQYDDAVETFEAPSYASLEETLHREAVSKAHSLLTGESVRSDFEKTQNVTITIPHHATCNVDSTIPPEVSDESSEDSKECEPSHRRLSLLSFLIALIGGGVFSLEAFEAFPML